jgi:hypothetical protein
VEKMIEAPTTRQPAQEHTFLAEGNVYVTNARLISGAQTYAVAGITSVRVTIEGAKVGFPIFLLIIGLLLLVGASVETTVGGLLLIALAILILRSQSPTHNLVLTTAAGEVRAIASKDREFIHRVHAALSNAIVSRA